MFYYIAAVLLEWMNIESLGKLGACRWALIAILSATQLPKLSTNHSIYQEL